MARRRPTAMGLLAVILVAVAACGSTPVVAPSAAPSTVGPAASGSLPGSPAPPPGHEVYGFVPYWEMDAGIAAHLRATDLTTLALFSVTNTRTGTIDTTQNGYRRITGSVGKQVIAEAHQRGVRVEVVFTSFGAARNQRLFTDLALQDATIASLVGLVAALGVDGVDVDVEGLDPELVAAYGAFVGRLRTAVLAADARAEVSVATGAHLLGGAMAAAAAEAGADRVFLMGYDYRVAGSEPGGTAPLDRRDGGEKDLPWSLDLYAALGVPVERTLLGLPLYGMSWPVADAGLGSPATGPGETWILRYHADLLTDPSVVPIRDTIEVVELYVLAADGTALPPSPSPGSIPPGAGGPTPPTSPSPAATAAPAPAGLRAVYVDSPATLEAKLALANARGLAGAGFWAIGYERGLPEYTDLIAQFAAGATMHPAP